MLAGLLHTILAVPAAVPCVINHTSPLKHNVLFTRDESASRHSLIFNNAPVAVDMLLILELSVCHQLYSNCAYSNCTYSNFPQTNTNNT